MTKIIKLYLKKSVRRLVRPTSIYRNCQLVINAMSKRGVVVADSYLRSRYGLDLFAVLTTCKALLHPADSSHIAQVSLKFLSAKALQIFNECTNREEILCKLYELKHQLNNAMQYQLQFAGIINENVATTRSLDRIIDSTIFSINCLDVNFISNNSLALRQTFDLLGYITPQKLAALNTQQVQNLISLLLWRAALVAEQTVFGKLSVQLKSAIKLLNRYIKKAPKHPPLALVKLVLLNIYSEDTNEYRLIKNIIATHEMLESVEAKNNQEDINLRLFEKNEPIAA